MRGEIDVVFLPVQAAWVHMEASGGGSIVNFASVNALRGSGTFGMAAHCAGKSAGAHEGAARDTLLTRIPWGRVRAPEDIAWCAVGMLCASTIR